MVRRINDQPLDIGCEILKYMQERTRPEVDKELIKSLNGTMEVKALWSIHLSGLKSASCSLSLSRLSLISFSI